MLNRVENLAEFSAMRFKIGQRCFATQKEAFGYYGGLRNRVAEGSVQAHVYHEEIDAVFRHHPEYSERVANRAVLRYGVLVGKFQTPCFCVIYDDGTVEDFSFWKCVRNAARECK